MKWARQEQAPDFKKGGPDYVQDAPFAAPAAKGQNVDLKQRGKFIEKVNFNSVKELYKKGFREWLICNKKKDWDIICQFTEDDRFSYEAYVGGFLAYYEIHVSKSKKRENRTVYFDWGRINKSVPLTIYLRPVNKPYYDNNGKLIGDKKSSKPVVWKNAPAKAQRSPLAPPPAPNQTDPPIPPVPPPPPPRYNDQI